jgi:hypothetical protein
MPDSCPGRVDKDFRNEEGCADRCYEEPASERSLCRSAILKRVLGRGAAVTVPAPDHDDGARNGEGTPSGPGWSPTAEAFGATVEVAAGGVQLCLVVGRAGMPDRAVRSVGGRTVLRLPDGRRLLAVVRLETLLALQAHADVALAGPVTIDAERFGRFAELVGLDEAADGGDDGDHRDTAA